MSDAVQSPTAYPGEGRVFSPLSCAGQNLTCQLLVAGGGLSGLSAAEAAMRSGLNVIVVEKAAFGQVAASGLNAGQFLTGWAKSVDTMLAELVRQEQDRGLTKEQARERAIRRLRAFLRSTIEGCLRLAKLDHDYNLRASVLHGAAMAALNASNMAILESTYDFMEKSNFGALMPSAKGRRRRFFDLLLADRFQERFGTAAGIYSGGVIDYFGGSFRPRMLLNGLGRSLQKRGVRLFQNTDAQALDFSGDQLMVFCGNGASIRADALFMANAYARHINGDLGERTIFMYDYVVEVELPHDADVLKHEPVLSDMRDPCFYARRHGRHLYMGYDESAETSPAITRRIARSTFAEGKRIFSALRDLGEEHIKGAWCGAIYYTLDDYPFVERRHGGRVITFAAPSDHGNSLAIRVGELVGNLVAHSTRPSGSDEDVRQRRRDRRLLKLFEDFPKGLRLRPGRRYQEAASAGPPASGA
jgi:gamma-glutamylputrescine oxidase